MTELSFPSLTLLALGLTYLLVARYIRSVLSWKARSRGRPLPPGPTPLPIVGNIFSAPKTKAWEAYRDMSQTYGDIISLQMLGQRVMILGSAKAALELLEKRSGNYSDRPVSPMIELIGWEWDFGFMPYGQPWRRHRRLFWQHFHPGVVSKYHAVQREASAKFLENLLASPEQLEDHIRYAFASSVLKAVYGIEVAERGDKIVDTVETAMEGVAAGMTPGSFLVEYLPFLRYVPEWVPGAGFQKRLKRWRDASHTMVDLPFEEAKEAMKHNDPRSSVVGTILSSATPGVDEELAKNVAAIAYAGGADTTISTFQTFFLAMSLHPKVQERARAELAAAVGADRLPDLSDRDALPFIDAIIKECIRWQNAAPIGLPHAVVEDDEYDGYFIPAGTVTFPNAWAILHNVEEYPDPDSFLPERFLKDGRLNPDVRDPATVAFGFGRRICPGRYFADAALFLNIARVLHVFDISAPLDVAGQPIRIQPKMKDGFLSYPEDCRCSIKPLSARAEALILTSPANDVPFET
ncbi:CyP450 monooxygenase [Trametes versicolor FP-101664 SS1]|uniref:CyP450 monooxygenase n=1 Tax=Trametes versicolor (strain FP-101664) TaxID=717944 RepID=UPI0004623069|nr:CyP450 monooxygenase [Trametes versicolor FP-101664 SS1]EIW59412.1 CyP450 monooxygenase [Trametes versicolor FP-101664 SS1]